MFEGDAAIANATSFWNAAFEHGAQVNGDWYLGKSIKEPGPPSKKVFNFSVAAGAPEGQRTILYHDSTIFGSGKKGLLLTDKYLYIHCSDDDKIWYINLPSARASFDAASNTLQMNDKKSSSLTCPTSLARTLEVFFRYMQDPTSTSIDFTLKRIWNPTACEPFLAQLKQMGIRDDFLTPMVGEIQSDEKLLSNALGCIFTSSWIVTTEHGSFKRHEKVYFVTEQEHQSPAHAAHAFKDVVRHPTPIHIAIAAIATLMHVTHAHTYSLFLLPGGGANRIKVKSGCTSEEIANFRNKAAAAGVSVN